MITSFIQKVFFCDIPIIFPIPSHTSELRKRGLEEVETEPRPSHKSRNLGNMDEALTSPPRSPVEPGDVADKTNIFALKIGLGPKRKGTRPIDF